MLVTWVAVRVWTEVFIRQLVLRSGLAACYKFEGTYNYRFILPIHNLNIYTNKTVTGYGIQSELKGKLNIKYWIQLYILLDFTLSNSRPICLVSYRCTECDDELDKSKISFWVGLLQVFIRPISYLFYKHLSNLDILSMFMKMVYGKRWEHAVFTCNTFKLKQTVQNRKRT